MNKKGNLLNIIPLIVIFSFLSIFFLTIYLANYGIINDYMLVNLQNVTENLAENDIIVDQTPIHTQSWAESYSRIPTYFDGAWLGVYVIFILSTLYFAYLTKPVNYLGFFSVLFYGLMFILFMLYLVVTMTDWWQDQILGTMLPNWGTTVPILSFFMNNTGMFVLIHVIACMLVNLVDIDLSKIFVRKRKEKDVVESEEVL